MDAARVCGKFWLKPYANRPEVILCRTYRVPDDTPELPFAHRFLLPEWDGKEFEITPPEGNLVGFLPKRVRYDRGVAPVGWRNPAGPGGHGFIGTEQQWSEGSLFPMNPPLVWRGGFSTACTANPNAQGAACATGCELCPRVSAIWIADGFANFAGLTQGAMVKKEGCQFDTLCVPAPYCPTGTAAAWQVVLENPVGGLTGGVMAWRGGSEWSTCCKGA